MAPVIQRKKKLAANLLCVRQPQVRKSKGLSCHQRKKRVLLHDRGDDLFPGPVLMRRLSSLTRFESAEERKENKQCGEGGGGREMLPGKCDAPMLLGTAAQSPFFMCVCVSRCQRPVGRAQKNIVERRRWGRPPHHFFLSIQGV